MKIFHASDAPTGPGDPNTFVGAVRTARLASDTGGAPVHAYRVEFADGARTNWHTHSGPQWLFVIEGHIRIQMLGGPSHDLAAGDAVVVHPGEKHWHGAVPGSRGVHLAVNINATTTWLEPVADKDYRA